MNKISFNSDFTVIKKQQQRLRMLHLTEKLFYQCRISFHKRQRHIRVDRFRLRHYTVPRCYSYHKTLYTLHHTNQHYIRMDNVRLRDDMVPRCYSYHMSVDIADRMCYYHILKKGENYLMLQDRFS